MDTCGIMVTLSSNDFKTTSSRPLLQDDLDEGRLQQGPFSLLSGKETEKQVRTPGSVNISRVGIIPV